MLDEGILDGEELVLKKPRTGRRKTKEFQIRYKRVPMPLTKKEMIIFSRYAYTTEEMLLLSDE